MTREEWLEQGIKSLRERFSQAGYPLPEKVHVSVGFPSKGGLASARGQVIGQCWNGCQSADGLAHVFISPLLASGVDALDTLAHELVHAVLPKGSGHKALFVKACNAVGLTEGKPKSRSAGAELRIELERLNSLAPYPHAALDAKSMPKAQGTRLVKVVCGECGYVARVTRVWLDGPGAPICPTCSEQMEEGR